MVIVYYKENPDKSFDSLPKAKAYIHDILEKDWSKNPEDYRCEDTFSG